MVIELVIDDIPSSLNKYLGNSKDYNIYRREKERWHWLIKAALCKTKKPAQPFEKAEVYVTYFFKDRRRRDRDNYSGKMLLDPLVREGIIKDDSFDDIYLNVDKGGVDKLHPRTEIEIIQIEEDVMIQCERIVQYCAEFGSITTMQAFHDLGVTRLASRINDLRNQGYAIDSEFVSDKNRYGDTVSFKRYMIKT